jgi:hypothetical protein
MGVAMLGLVIGILTAAGVGLCARWIAGQCGCLPKTNDRIFGIAALVAFPCVVPFTLGGMIWLFTMERIGLNGAGADAILQRWGVPNGAASDLCYYRSARMSEFADFQMLETDFLAWMKVRGLTPRRFTFDDELRSLQWNFNGKPETVTTLVYPVRSRGNDAFATVQDGYCYHERYSERAESFETIIYDVNANRAYIFSPH